MNNTHPSPKASEIAMPFGITFGAIMILMFVASFALEIDPLENKWVGISMQVLNYLVIPILFISLALNKFKSQNHGYITLGEGLKNGVLLMLIAALVYGVFYTIFVYAVPEFIEEALAKTRDVMMDQNPSMSSDQIDLALSFTETFMKPYLAVPVTIAIYSFIGLIYSLIIGAIVQKKRDNFVV
jgi:hypothetical protein